jgi:hypothetical protein
MGNIYDVWVRSVIEIMDASTSQYVRVAKEVFLKSRRPGLFATNVQNYPPSHFASYTMALNP